jgi:peptidoglycan/xylan/chitin deacetylase (PgdA/CDA1 family)
MYHYVRPISDCNLFYIKNENFEKQLDFFQEYYGIITRDEWCSFRSTGRLPRGALLTFDDGLKDHIENVIPILVKKNIFAIFYVCTDPFHNKPLSVHLTHYLLARFSVQEIRNHLQKRNIVLDKNLFFDNKSLSAYKNQNLNEVAKDIKRVVNWAYQDLGQRDTIADIFCELTGKTLIDFTKEWYLNQTELIKISNLGYEIGSHTCSHRLLSNLKASEFVNELNDSKNELSEIINHEIRSFCYPFGGPNSYNKDITKELKKAGYSESFSVDASEIGTHLKLNKSIFELPRYDCNIFPYYS